MKRSLERFRFTGASSTIHSPPVVADDLLLYVHSNAGGHGYGIIIMVPE